jgi:RNA polymerase sigma-70 factor (ECF subfamily)
MEDAELVTRILEGERELFRTLVGRHQSRIYYLGAKFFRRREEREDFVQEVFLRCYRKLGSYSGKAPFAAWLYRLAYNLALNTRRFQARLREDFYPVMEEADPGHATPEQHFLDGEAKEELNRAVASLGGFSAWLIRLYYFEEFDYRTISEITGMPVGTLKSHLHRIRGRLREELTRGKGEEDE